MHQYFKLRIFYCFQQKYWLYQIKCTPSKIYNIVHIFCVALTVTEIALSDSEQHVIDIQYTAYIHIYTNPPCQSWSYGEIAIALMLKYHVGRRISRTRARFAMPMDRDVGFCHFAWTCTLRNLQTSKFVVIKM